MLPLFHYGCVGKLKVFEERNRTASRFLKSWKEQVRPLLGHDGPYSVIQKHSAFPHFSELQLCVTTLVAFSKVVIPILRTALKDLRLYKMSTMGTKEQRSKIRQGNQYFNNVSSINSKGCKSGTGPEPSPATFIHISSTSNENDRHDLWKWEMMHLFLENEYRAVCKC